MLSMGLQRRNPCGNPMTYIYKIFCILLILISLVVTGAQAQQPGQDTVPIQLDLDDTDIYSVVRIVADTLDINIVIDPQVKGRANVSTFGTLQRSDLLPILETILKMNGATLIRTGNYYQILPAANALRAPLAVQSGAPAASPDDQITIDIVRMRYVAATEMAKLLAPYVGDGGNI